MKRGLFIFTFLILFSSNVFAICNVDISMLNQDPYPAIPGENVKIVFQIITSGADCSGTIPMQFIEKYPFTLDFSSEKSYNIPTNIYARDYSSSTLAPFTVRVDKDALDGETPLEIQYGSAIKKFFLNVGDVRSDFELFVENYNYLNNEFTFEIQNIAGNDASGITVEIPIQDGVKIIGTNMKNIGSLSRNEDTNFDFNLVTDNDNNAILVKIHYSDSTNTRRIVEKKIDFNSDNFEQTPESKYSFKVIIPLVLVIGLILYFILKKYKKHKKYKKV